jgi:hypothetical protein
MNADGFAMGSSTLLCSRRLLDLEPWDDQLRLHEDWEWLLRVSHREDAVVAMHPDPLVRYLDQPVVHGSSQPAGGWRASMAFADRSGLTGRTRGDFLLCVTAAMAIAHREWRSALRVAAVAGRTARPSPRAWAVFILQLLLPRTLLAGIASRIPSRAQRRGIEPRRTSWVRSATCWLGVSR